MSENKSNYSELLLEVGSGGGDGLELRCKVAAFSSGYMGTDVPVFSKAGDINCSDALLIVEGVQRGNVDLSHLSVLSIFSENVGAGSGSLSIVY